MSMTKVGILISVLNLSVSCNIGQASKPIANTLPKQQIAEIPADKTNDDTEIGGSRRGK